MRSSLLPHSCSGKSRRQYSLSSTSAVGESPGESAYVDGLYHQHTLYITPVEYTTPGDGFFRAEHVITGGGYIHRRELYSLLAHNFIGKSWR